MSTTQQVIEQTREQLSKFGVRAALVCLNLNSLHRFTALFRFEGTTLRNLYLIDREDATVEHCPDMPVLESYCVYIRDSGAKFLTEDADTDVRVLGHPKQPTVKSYCGLPLISSTGQLFGTICHFDFDAIPFAESEILVLEEMAPRLVSAIEAGDWKPQQSDSTAKTSHAT